MILYKGIYGKILFYIHFFSTRIPHSRKQCMHSHRKRAPLSFVVASQHRRSIIPNYIPNSRDSLAEKDAYREQPQAAQLSKK